MQAQTNQSLTPDGDGSSIGGYINPNEKATWDSAQNTLAVIDNPLQIGSFQYGNWIGWAGIAASSVQHGAPTGLSVGSNFKIYSNFYGNQYVGALPIGKIAGVAGAGLAVAGVGYDIYQYSQDEISGIRLTADSLIASVGIFGGAPGGCFEQELAFEAMKYRGSVSSTQDLPSVNPGM